jgi:formylglycine-generating enzyme required for sulfatase activity
MLRHAPAVIELSTILMLNAVLVPCQKLEAQSPQPTAPPEMVAIPSGVYRPLFRAASEPKEISVDKFYLDRFPVTTGEFLEFVRANPRWRRSQVKPLFADRYYLKNWKADLEPGPNAPLHAPATDVSWFAAKAFAQWKGKRLPTVAEWEYTAGAGTTRPDGENDTTFRQQVLRWYTTLGAAPGPVGSNQPNFWGVHDLHGLIWEWVLDFNTPMTTGDSRADNGGLERGLFCGAGAQNARDAGNYPAFMRLGFRSSLNADYCIHNLGFRCAKDL